MSLGAGDPRLADLVPHGVAVVETSEDGGYALLPEEAPLVATARPERVAEFATTRGCARSALRRLGYPPGPILRGPGGAPTWPVGVVGTLTHCASYRAAAVAPLSVVQSIGADAEPHAPLPTGVERLVTVPSEREQLAALRVGHPDVCWDRLLFCAKEALYKAWFPLTHRWLNFADVTVDLRADGTYVARLSAPTELDPLAAMVGRWSVGPRLLAVATLSPDPAAAGAGPP